MYKESPKKEDGQTMLVHAFGEKQRLHPAAIIFNFFFALKEMIFGLGIGLIISLKESAFYFFLFVLVFLLLLFLSSLLSWLRFTYYIKDGELRVEQGIFIRKKRYISLHRIHKVDVTANVIHRLFRLVKVQVDTASSSQGAEVMLSAVKMEDAAILRRALKTTNHETERKTESTYPMTKISWQRLFAAGTTSGSVGFLFVAALAGFTQLEEFIPRHVFNSTYQYIVSLGVVVMIFLVICFLFLLWLIGIANTMIKYGNFTIKKGDNELFITRGLLETKELTIPFERIQAIGIEQSIIRQPFRYVTVYAVVAGGSFDKKETFPVLFPLLKEAEVADFIEEFLPDYREDEGQKRISLPRPALKYYIFQHIWFFVVLFLASLYVAPAYSWIPAILSLLAICYGWLSYHHGEISLSGKQVTLQTRRLFCKIRIRTYKRRIQSLTTSQNPLQRKSNLQTINLSLIGSTGLGTHYELKHLQANHAEKLADWYASENLKSTCQKTENELIYSTK